MVVLSPLVSLPLGGSPFSNISRVIVLFMFGVFRREIFLLDVVVNDFLF